MTGRQSCIRYNSWDFLHRPIGMLRTVWRALIDPLSHWPAIAASLVFAGLVLGCYVTLLTLRAEPADEESR